MEKIRKLVGYVKVKRQRTGLPADDVKMQANAIHEYAKQDEHSPYEVIKIFYEEQVLDFDKNKNFSQLTAAQTMCNKNDASFIYVELGPWRYNAIFFNFVQNYKRRLKAAKQRREVIAIQCTEVIDLIKRQAREERIFTKEGATRTRRSQEAQKDVDENRDRSLVWKRLREVRTKQFKNFMHLTDGATPINQVIESHAQLFSSEIARILNKGHYLTVDGKRWTGDNVRRIKKMQKDPKFKDFIFSRNNNWKNL